MFFFLVIFCEMLIFRTLRKIKKKQTKKICGVCLPLSHGEFDASLIKKACDGMGFDSEILCEVMCTRTNQAIKEMIEAWNKMGEKKSIEDRIYNETHKMIGANNFQNLMLKIDGMIYQLN